ncbi:MAG: hypothetical protein H0T45_09805 [Pyrinomonadaceae bacterium]|nr:hypothetical protein [Pyrinomonadaceae bacterium]
MPDTGNLKVEFNGPEHGWLTVTLSAREKEYGFMPSHAPYDSINELVSALLKVVDGYTNAVVRWNDEPVEHEFLFDVESEQVDFKVYKIIQSSVAGRTREKAFAFNGSLYKVVRPFWKALRDMESKQSLAEYERQWREPFPEREMRELTQKIKAFKKLT